MDVAKTPPELTASLASRSRRRYGNRFGQSSQARRPAGSDDLGKDQESDVPAGRRARAGRGRLLLQEREGRSEAVKPEPYELMGTWSYHCSYAQHATVGIVGLKNSRQSTNIAALSEYMRFSRSISLSVRPVIGPPLKKGDPVTRTGGYTALTRPEQIAMDLFNGFLEVSHSYDRLLDIEVYASRFPYGNTRITRMGHLRFVVEAYLHESYTLAERLESYPKVITRRLGKLHPDIDYARACKNAQDFAKAALKNIVDVRGSHVHQRRFSTPDLDHADMYDLFRTLNDAGEDKLLGEFVYREARRKWLKLIRTNNLAIGKLLDAYLLRLHPLLFSSDGESFSHLASAQNNTAV